ncbi:MAG TPA: hypothetical protein VFX07_02330 [Candidatus Udaeobacter sp.]|jgi:hypothetical protein|nr:hypothetical protein [Candidatus Udaeobacter sp.]
MKNSIIFISVLSLVAMLVTSCESVFSPDEPATSGVTDYTNQPAPERSGNSIDAGHN